MLLTLNKVNEFNIEKSLFSQLLRSKLLDFKYRQTSWNTEGAIPFLVVKRIEDITSKTRIKI